MNKPERNSEEMKEKILKDAVSKGALTKLEHTKLLEARKLRELKMDTISYKVFLEGDSVKRGLAKNKHDVLNEVKAALDLKNIATRHEISMKSGDYPELKPGVPMTKEELDAELFAANFKAWATTKDIIPSLIDLRRWVNVKDLENKIIMTEEQYDEFVKETEARLSKVGLKLFD